MERMMIKAYFDGACAPVNPGGIASYGALIIKDDILLFKISEIVQPEAGKEKETSNNLAEYHAFKSILIYLIENNLTKEEIQVFGDSMLVISQMFGNHCGGKKWRINKGIYVRLAYECQILLNKFENINGWWIPREDNMIADNLADKRLKKGIHHGF